jgi:hypothetical protein
MDYTRQSDGEELHNETRHADNSAKIRHTNHVCKESHGNYLLQINKAKPVWLVPSLATQSIKGIVIMGWVAAALVVLMKASGAALANGHIGHWWL